MRIAIAGLVPMAVAALVAGCGGGGGNSSTATSPGAGIQQPFIQVVKSVSPQVVQIKTPTGLGSGIVFDTKGDIVTNAHVVGSDQQFTVTLNGGKQRSATLIGSDPAGDIAVVRLSGSAPEPATFGDSSKIQVGELALAIGNPLGLRSSVTQGIVSSVGRTVSEENGVTLPSVIQTSAAINPGNSGGALVDVGGRVIGIPTLAATDPQLGGGAAPGIGFAIPSNTVRQVATKLISSSPVPRTGLAFLGVDLTTPVSGGVMVANVVPSGPAATAGIAAGDAIHTVAGKPTSSIEGLNSILATLQPGQKAVVTVVRPDGRQETVTVVLGKRPAAGG
jgi:S1-C subfamily serine protease